MKKDDINIKEYINNFYNNNVYNEPRTRSSYGLYEDDSKSGNSLKNKNVNRKTKNKDNNKKGKSSNNKPKIRVNNKKSKNSKNRQRKRINFKRLTFFTLIFIITTFSIYFVNDSKKVKIILDAGHGGEDVGAVKDGRYEKDDTLAMVNLIKEELKDNKDIKIILTRDNDKYVSLEDRTNISNKKKVKMFVSLHRNSAEIGNGVEIWINSDHSIEEEEIAKEMMEALDKTNISRNRGVRIGTNEDKDSDYYVNKYTNADSMIIELGFINNTLDNSLFDQNKKAYAKSIAEVIENNIYRYKEEK